MMYNCYLDIETIPTQSQAVRDQIAATITPPGNMSSEATIAKWEAEKKPAAVQDAIAKTSFDPARGHICTIAWAMDDGEVQSHHASYVDEERDILCAFFDSIRANHKYTFIGHYIGGFDLRFILCRAVVLGVKIPRGIPRDPKPWDSGMFDTMQAWAGAKGSISMDNLAAALGLEGKGDFDGSMVAQAWADGEHERIAEYCAADVQVTRDIHRKFMDAGW